MKFYIPFIVALGVASLYYSKGGRLGFDVIRTVTVRGDSPSAPVPVTLDLQIHRNGLVTWKRP
jgi:hypothetical protein